MTDHDLLTAFTTGSLDPAAFRHRDHVRVAWLMLERHPRAEAERRLLEGLRALAERAGKAERFSARLTSAWIDLIAAARAEHPHARNADDLAALRPDLLDPKAVRVAAMAPTT